MSNPFFINKGPYDILEILKLLKSKDLNYLNEDALKKRGNFQILDHVK